VGDEWFRGRRRATRPETYHAAGHGEAAGHRSAALLPTFRHLPISRQPFAGTRLTQPSQNRAYTPGFWRMTGVFPDCRGSGTALAQIPTQQQRAQRRIQSAAGSPAGQLLPRVARSWAMPRVTGESAAYGSPHPASFGASRPREMQGGACDRWSWRQGTGGRRTMHTEHRETTWPEAVTALAVMGILVFLLLI
jgi:hypothetical protein